MMAYNFLYFAVSLVCFLTIDRLAMIVNFSGVLKTHEAVPIVELNSPLSLRRNGLILISKFA